MRVLVEIENVDIVELDVEILIDGLQGPADPDVIFEFDRDGLVGEGLEKAVMEEESVPPVSCAMN